MRIFQVLEHTANELVSGNQTWYRNLHEPLLDLGHDVVLLDATEGRRALQKNDVEKRADFSQKLLDRYKEEHAKQPFDLFFAYLMDGMIDPGAIDEIRKTGVPTCNFSCNNIHQFTLVDDLAPHFDYNLHAERDAAEKFHAIGATAIWWQMASNPKYFRPQSVSRTIPVSFVGANYALRARYIKHLLDHDVDVHAYGPLWKTGASKWWRSVAKHYKLLLEVAVSIDPQKQFRAAANLADHDFRRSLSSQYPKNVHGPVSDDELIGLYSRSQITLGFLEVYLHHDASSPVLQHLHLREFEAPMSGALYCTGYTDELTEFFEPDKEVVVYRNQHELLDKVRYYLGHPQEAEQVRLAGYKRAVQEHSYHRRFEALFNNIGLEKQS